MHGLHFNIFLSTSNPKCPICRRTTTRRELVKLIFSHDISVPNMSAHHVAGASSTNFNDKNQNPQHQLGIKSAPATKIATASTSRSNLQDLGAISHRNKKARADNKLVAQAPLVQAVAATSSTSIASAIPGRITARRVTRSAAATSSSISSQYTSIAPAIPGRITARRVTRSNDRSQIDQIIRFTSKKCVICTNFFLASNMDVCDACRQKLDHN